MLISCLVTIANGDTLVTRTGGNSWAEVMLPAWLSVTGVNDLYMIAEINVNPDWLHLARPYIGPAITNAPATVVTDFTPQRELPLANIGDVNMADLFNRAMMVLDQLQAAVPIHGPTHVGLGLDPIPLCSTTDSGLIGPISGNSTDYIGGDGLCHPNEGVPSGTVVDFAGSTLPQSWLLCNGAAVSRVSYPNLFGAIGTMYGAGDGSTTFNLPNCLGRARVGAGNGAGLSARNLGDMGGEENHTLSVNELAVHNHVPGDPGHTHTDSGHVHDIVNPIGGLAAQPGSGQYSAQGPVNTQTGYAAISTSGTNITIGNTGAGWGHNNMQPFIVFNAIIRI